MGFDRGEIRIKATNISIMDRKGGKSIMGCRVMKSSFLSFFGFSSRHQFLFLISLTCHLLLLEIALGFSQNMGSWFSPQSCHLKDCIKLFCFCQVAHWIMQM